MPLNLTISLNDTTKTYESYNIPSTLVSGRLWSCGVEQQDLTYDEYGNSNREFDAVGNATVSTTVYRSGAASANINVAGPQGYLEKQVIQGSYTGRFFSRGYLYVAAFPTNITTTASNNNNDTTIFQYFNDNGGISCAEITIDGSGVLRCYQDGSIRSVIATSSAISLNTWYRIEFGYGATAGYVEMLLNGVSQGSTHTATGLSGANTPIWGSSLINNEEAATVNLYWDDMAVNIEGGSYQNSWPGAGQIVNLIPAGQGDNNGFTINVGGTLGQINNYTRVNSFGPINDSQYNGDIVSGDIDDFTVTPTPSTISSGDSINVVHLNIRARASAVSNTAILNTRLKKVPMGTLSIGPVLNIFYTSFANGTGEVPVPYSYCQTLYNDPDGNPWHKSTLDSAQIGYQLLNDATTEVDVSDVWLVVDSTPGDANLLINTSDTTVTSESITFDYELYFGVSDTTTTSESVNATQILEISVVSDVTATGEMAVVAPPYVVILDDPSDTTLVNEDITVLIPLAGHLYINTLDSVSTAESVSSVQESHTYIGVYGPLIFNIETQPYIWAIVRKNPNDP